MNLNNELSIWWCLYWTCSALNESRKDNFHINILETIEYFDSLIDDLKGFEAEEISLKVWKIIEEKIALVILQSFLGKLGEIYSESYSEIKAKSLIIYFQKCIIADKNFEISLNLLEKKYNWINIWEENKKYNTLYILVPKENIKEKMLIKDYQVPHILKIEWKDLKIETWNEHNFRIHLWKNYKSTSYWVDENWKIVGIHKSTNLRKEFYETDDLYY
jgi:hypothetical protein